MPICTVVARNYLARARVLAESLSRHGEERLRVLLLDDPDASFDDAGEPFDVVRPHEVGLPGEEFRRMAGAYTLLELATATKAWLLASLVEESGAAMYLDPDMVVHAPLDPLRQAAGKSTHGLALTPHRLTPVPLDGRTPAELELVRSGVFNLGFIAVTRDADAFLDWWKARLRRECVVAVAQGVFVDQRWIDQAPALWAPTVVDDPGFNVAYWNLDERPLRRSPDGSVLAADTPLRLMHWSGYDLGRQHLLSGNSGDAPRVLLSEQPVLRELHEEYGEALAAAARERDSADSPYRWAGTPEGFTLDYRARSLYREALVASERGGEAEPPNPFVDGAGFVEWLRTPAPRQPAAVSRYLRTVWDARADLQSVFPDLSQPEGFLAWCREWGQVDGGVPEAMIPAAAAPPSSSAPSTGRPPGVNVAGYLAAESGVGEGARLLAAALGAGRIDHALVPYTETLSRQHDPFGARSAGSADYDVNVVCVNADELPRFAQGSGRELFDGRPTVGMWAWEVTRFPDEMAAAARFVDEIWMGSRHAAAAVQQAVDVPVFSFPLPVVAPGPPQLDRAALGLPEGFLFLFAFSFHSLVERKNPFAVLDAFTQAFAPGEGPVLVIKSIHGDHLLHELERLRATARHRPDVVILDEVLDRADHASLMHACNAYVSLHRAEGFGLTMAEAMALGKPVVATAYSGNLEYMSPANSWLVPYHLTAVGPGKPPYPADALWADPDVELAAAAMREIFDNPREAERRGRRAAADVAEFHGPAVRSRFVAERLAALREARPATSPPQPDTGVVRLVAPASQLARRAVARLPAEQRARVRRLLAAGTGRLAGVGQPPPNPNAGDLPVPAQSGGPASLPVPATSGSVLESDTQAVDVVGTNLGPVVLPVDEVVHPWVAHYHSWEDDIAAVLRAALRPGDTAVDIGAHVGLHTVFMAACVGPTGRVVAIEPDATNLDLLRSNLETRWYASGVEVVAGAAWEADVQLALTPSATNSGDHRVAPSPGGPIRGLRIDQLVGDADVRAVKVDAQGSDHVALAGLEGTLRRSRPVVIVEFSPADTRAVGFDPEVVGQWYTDLGLGVEVLGHRDAPSDAKDLIARADAAEEGFVTLVLGRE